MKKLKTTLLTSALIAVASVPAMATEGKKTKEIKSLVGYNVTEKVEYKPAKKAAFMKVDANSDGIITAKEFRNGSNLENPYEDFLLMDTSGDKQVTIDEFANYNKTKGHTQVESQLHGKVAVRGTNLKSRVITEQKTYYQPVEPTVVEIKNIEPAAE
jgi:Ca2+-binding EF-hand superfamily protein